MQKAHISIPRLIENQEQHLNPAKEVIIIHNKDLRYVHQLCVLDDNDICIASLTYTPDDKGEYQLRLETKKKIVVV